MTVQESTAVAAEEEQHFHPDERETDADMEARARWAAATVILSYMTTPGVSSGAGACPHCTCPVLYVHTGPRSTHYTNAWTIYECIRCGASVTMADSHPHVVEYLAEVEQRVRLAEAEKAQATNGKAKR